MFIIDLIHKDEHHFKRHNIYICVLFITSWYLDGADSWKSFSREIQGPVRHTQLIAVSNPEYGWAMLDAKLQPNWSDIYVLYLLHIALSAEVFLGIKNVVALELLGIYLPE